MQTVALSEYLAWTSCLLTLSYSSSGQGMAGHTDGPPGSNQRTAAVFATSTLINISVVHQPPSERCCRSTDMCCRTSLVLHYKRQLRIFKIEKFVFITSA